MTTRVLVIEDDPALSAVLAYNLRAEEYDVISVASAEEGLLYLRAQPFDALILDWMLPGVSGIELCRRLSRSTDIPKLPILMLTARGEEADKIRGLRTGADDYVTKPFSVAELMARVAAIIRRSAPERTADMLSHADITMFRSQHRVTRGTREIKLGPTEYRLLELFLESKGRVLTRELIIDRVWGVDGDIDERTIDVHIGRLRRALNRGDDVDLIRTVRGAGYSLIGGGSA